MSDTNSSTTSNIYVRLLRRTTQIVDRISMAQSQVGHWEPGDTDSAEDRQREEKAQEAMADVEREFMAFLPEILEAGASRAKLREELSETDEDLAVYHQVDPRDESRILTTVESAALFQLTILAELAKAIPVEAAQPRYIPVNGEELEERYTTTPYTSTDAFARFEWVVRSAGRWLDEKAPEIARMESGKPKPEPVGLGPASKAILH